ncbi:MAG: hypothetical protein IT452_07905 [Planctomycetia bacterium]|nr:hypothetical protein [Planctomycetia bacterium]
MALVDDHAVRDAHLAGPDAGGRDAVEESGGLEFPACPGAGAASGISALYVPATVRGTAPVSA